MPLEEFLGLSASVSFLHNIYHWVSQPPNPTGVLASCEWTKALGLWVYMSQCRKAPEFLVGALDVTNCLKCVVEQ